MSTLILAPGDRVRLRTPGNDRLDGTLATVAELTSWGAHCDAPAAATGRYRAAWCEMEALADRDDGRAVRRALACGYDQQPCDRCGSLTLRRTGTCLTCETCASTSGCG